MSNADNGVERSPITSVIAKYSKFRVAETTWNAGAALCQEGPTVTGTVMSGYCELPFRLAVIRTKE